MIGLIALLIGILLPVLGKAREASKRTFCLNNIRNMELAQWNYLTDNRGYLIQAGLGHQSEADDLEVAWFTTLNRYYPDSSDWQHRDGRSWMDWCIDAWHEHSATRHPYGTEAIQSSSLTPR